MGSFFPKGLLIAFILLKLIPLVLFYALKSLFLALIPGSGKTKKNVAGQTVLITGAGSGLGRLQAIEFSKLSTCLVLVDVNKKALLDTEKLIEPNCRTFIYQCDVSKREKVNEVTSKIKADVGRIDILVNNAGIVSGKRLMDIPDESIERTMAVNALAHFWMCKAFLPEMMATNSGHIVSIASLAGVSGLPNLSDYCASKFAAVGLMESLRLELDAQGLNGVKLTTICPSLISTGLFEGTKPPLTVLMTPEFVVGEIMKAILEEKEFVMLPRWMYIIILLKWTMPKVAVERFYKNSGLLHFMDSFKGRTHAVDTNSNFDKHK